MSHLDPTEFHAHRTSCLSGGEFPCHVTLPEDFLDPIWDSPPLKVGNRHTRGRPTKPKKFLPLE